MVRTKGSPQDETGFKIGDGKTNYVPHHGVYHPRGPTHVRVVFNRSARYKGISLNKKGLYFTNNLMALFCLFRQETVALICDVKKMFHPFFLNKVDRDFIRLFW